jgi:hypothetical protein
MFYHEDYAKLKMMYIMLHKDAVKDVLTKADLQGAEKAR